MWSQNQHQELWKTQIWKSGGTERLTHGPEGSISDCVDTSREQMEMSTQDDTISQISEKQDEPWPSKR